MRLILDPRALHLYYPNASEATTVKVRLVGQVVDRTAKGVLVIARVPLVPEPDVMVDADPHVRVHVSGAETEASDHGDIVSVIGFYDGKLVHALEVLAVDPGVLMGYGVSVLSSVGDL